MTDIKVDSTLTSGQESLRIFESLSRGISRRSALQMLGVASVAVAGTGSLFGAAGKLLADEAAGPAKGKPGGRIRVAGMNSSTADTLDPAKGSGSTDYTRQFMFYNGLTRFDSHMVPQLELAERFDTTDATLWLITLRKEVTFHNGKPLTAADVVFSLLRHKNPVTGSKVLPLAEQFSEVKATSPTEVQIRLSGPNAELPSILAVSHFLIVPEGTTDFNLGIGTGPFKVKEFKPGMRSVAVRNPGYWKPGLPYLDEIEFIGIADEPSRINALLSGDVQITNEVDPRSTVRIKASGKHQVISAPSGNYTDLIIRQDQMPGKSAEFTQAMKYLLDREQIKSAVFRGFAVVGNDHPISPGARYYNADLPQTAYDPEKARFLLKKAGMESITMPLIASPAATGSVDMAVLLQQSAKHAGLKLDVSRLPSDGYWSNHWMKHPLSFGNINPRPSADVMFSQFFQSSAPWNESAWKNDQFDQLLLLSRGETDDAKRGKMYADMQTLVHDHCGIGIPVFISNIDGIDQRVKGYGSNPLGGFMGFMFAEQVWLDA
ncbi:Periplasmic dipeptide transport protein [Pseudomonas fluorescens]|uniref:Peptide/nickel transport system substrate-binding protein n=1 Tax=Pseudomonas salomonii TaxID=191391 RepID=A0A1H3G4E1_9PSED|nr:MULTISPECIES: ABC transporter substrate-binding protein [Pseudomonas]VVO06677.1 Periplasmic dipeptide transport protein [Pseudomonas fluorescens]MDI3250456.1 ABC transporter substrate-binding protein [Pseudomonas sp. AL10]MDI3266342.1 ABC transporter substrate-binding protein [Pseudomonas sp. AL15]NWN46645.1 ABC transporter substrate-binding protein [Pseudomonas allii]SDX98192.1 peptide/nickel transport system substrate-binding protein [Pseudomonas salomonii]